MGHGRSVLPWCFSVSRTLVFELSELVWARVRPGLGKPRGITSSPTESHWSRCVLTGPGTTTTRRQPKGFCKLPTPHLDRSIASHDPRHKVSPRPHHPRHHTHRRTSSSPLPSSCRHLSHQRRRHRLGYSPAPSAPVSKRKPHLDASRWATAWHMAARRFCECDHHFSIRHPLLYF
ncbi:uncharacterized protein B0I36DRAFT_340529 [Microdochium trichocladiopsis]|uniref:Uncharacterized protein n=1 Tax=Microdochium trichocladiopsis TaxID=1682393 RepID=A0A9P9BKX4_9PEZI|nr:uncharacterized protein B0I36DRAFT_340529 [Microdochium trichocladiopsis]KAH7012108.1 hypothetical protein B0I36DRAFT_340529 [Microdochium trichocladiopsis]